MGLIIHSDYQTIHGMVLQNVYVSTNFSQLSVEKRTNVSNNHRYNCSFTVFLSQEARLTNKSPIGYINSIVESESPIDMNIYTILYNKLKEMYPNSTDA